ncbi:MAG: ATP-dependent Clp protease proteolytic subunit [Candidatus Buchananbacteria bacterium]|jgi:ATP-dependent protease ClpP protease subunit
MDKYNNMLDLQKALLDNGVIDIAGEINEDTILYVREALLRLNTMNNPPINVTFTSSGGNCDAGFAIFDLLGNYPGHITGTVTGFANSMASIILQACDVRRVSVHSRICLHYSIQPRLTRKQRKVPSERNKVRKNSDKVDGQFLDAYMTRAIKTRRAINKYLEDEKELSAQEAIAAGLADEIITPKIGKKPRGGK